MPLPIPRDAPVTSASLVMARGFLLCGTIIWINIVAELNRETNTWVG